MKKNKGFTVVEMGISFCLIFTICILLFQVVLSLKELYIRSDIETTLLNKQGIILNKMYKDFENKGIINVSSCGETCVSFNFYNEDKKELKIDQSKKTIDYDGYTWKLDSTSTIGTLNFETKELADFGNYFKINVSITNKLIDTKDFGLDIVYGY